MEDKHSSRCSQLENPSSQDGKTSWDMLCQVLWGSAQGPASKAAAFIL